MSDICCIEGCEKPRFAKGMCGMHYARVRKYGDPTKGVSKQLHGLTPKERFEAYAGKTESGCWTWTSHRDKNGYGRLSVDGVPVLAHRFSWELHNGPIPEGMGVLHKCDNPPCTNPEHLFLGDQAANNADMISKGRFSPGVSRGEDHGSAKLTANQVRAIRQSGKSPTTLADEFGISRRTVRDIQTMKSWTHIN